MPQTFSPFVAPSWKDYLLNIECVNGWAIELVWTFLENRISLTPATN
jgi:hypothetical protein